MTQKINEVIEIIFIHLSAEKNYGFQLEQDFKLITPSMVKHSKLIFINPSFFFISKCSLSFSSLVGIKRKNSMVLFVFEN